MAINSLTVGSFTVLQKGNNQKSIARISASESGIALPYNNFTQIKLLLDDLQIDYNCDDNG
jgi:hypothetical protein